LAGVVGIIAGVLEVVDRVDETSSSQTERQPPGEPGVDTSSAGASPPATSPGSASGSGRSASTEDAKSACISSKNQSVDCREFHRYEQLPGDCSTAALLNYMGGRAGLDVALGHPTASNSGGCFLDNGREVSSSARGVLAVDDGDDAWRRCYDDRRNIIVSCDEPHTGEYVATGGESKASQAECATAARTYMGRSIAANAELLQVQVIAKTGSDPNLPRCLISIRGAQRLGASVRRIGINTLPVVS
jgi:hypothetical protein